jgi:two-component system CheB/CheR fusion protein
MTSEQAPAFEALLQYLRDSRGFDFTGYKRSSLIRRVERRMQQVEISSYAEYLDYLQVHTDEFTALFNMILINVTAFLRDMDAWAHLRDDVLPELIAARKPNEPIRVWSAGCASGEEAYSMAMILADILGPEEFRERVKIYATDVDDDALNQARHASYTEREMKSVPDDLRERYFEMQNGRYVFRIDLRRSVIFGRNDLVQDAPISRVDLLVCRNTLMYFNAETQSRILGRFHFSLAGGGVLFLGKAEMLLSHGQLFSPLDLKRRFFRSVPRARHQRTGGLAAPNGNDVTYTELGDVARLRFEALSASPLASIVVNSQGTLAFANHRAEALFNVHPRDVGRPFRDLEVSYRPTDLRTAIDQVVAGRRPTWVKDVEWARLPGESMTLDIQVVPLIEQDSSDVGVALFFTDVSPYRKLQTDLEFSNRQLETAYEELQSTVEELETTNEELQSTVEELETTNEELQSTNEELETMNEELQSTNDELQTINDELRDRTQELDDTNGFMQSILRSLRSAVIVVDNDLVVQVWNARADDLWGMRAEEAVGRHLLNIDIGLSTELLKPLVRQTLREERTQDELRVDAINRKGRPIRVRVVCSPLQLGEVMTGAILVIDETAG